MTRFKPLTSGSKGTALPTEPEPLPLRYLSVCNGTSIPIDRQSQNDKEAWRQRSSNLIIVCFQSWIDEKTFRQTCRVRHPPTYLVIEWTKSNKLEREKNLWKTPILNNLLCFNLIRYGCELSSVTWWPDYSVNIWQFDNLQEIRMAQ